MNDVVQVRVLLVACVVVVCGLAFLHVFVSPAVAPRVNIRWAAGVDDVARESLEQQFRLFAAEHREGTTWAYDLRDPSWQTVRALVAHPAVADTHYINRRFGIVSASAPRGTTPAGRGVLSTVRDSAALQWLGRLALSILVVAAIWVVTNGRTARRETIPRTRPPT